MMIPLTQLPSSLYPSLVYASCCRPRPASLFDSGISKVALTWQVLLSVQVKSVCTPWGSVNLFLHLQMLTCWYTQLHTKYPHPHKGYFLCFDKVQISSIITLLFSNTAHVAFLWLYFCFASLSTVHRVWAASSTCWEHKYIFFINSWDARIEYTYHFWDHGRCTSESQRPQSMSVIWVIRSVWLEEMRID